MSCNGRSAAVSRATPSLNSSARGGLLGSGLARAWIVPVAAALALACDNDDPPVETPPDLSGTYDIVSLTQGGVTIAPPVVTGTIVLAQDSVAGPEARGTMVMNVIVAVPPVDTLRDQGTYINRFDSTWVQSGQAVQATGKYSLNNDTLKVNVTAPAAAASTTVWKRK